MLRILASAPTRGIWEKKTLILAIVYITKLKKGKPSMKLQTRFFRWKTCKYSPGKCQKRQLPICPTDSGCVTGQVQILPSQRNWVSINRYRPLLLAKRQKNILKVKVFLWDQFENGDESVLIPCLMWWKVELSKGRGRWLVHFRLGGCVYGFRRHRGVHHKSNEEFVFLYGAKINYIPYSTRKTWPSSFDDNAKKKLHPTIYDAPLCLLIKGKVTNLPQLCQPLPSRHNLHLAPIPQLCQPLPSRHNLRLAPMRPNPLPSCPFKSLSTRRYLQLVEYFDMFQTRHNEPWPILKPE
jgi:hypothetical protein